jgi:hypothetical protein
MKDSQDISARKLIDRLVPDPHWGAMHGLLATTFELRPDFLEMDFLPSAFGSERGMTGAGPPALPWRSDSSNSTRP